MGPARKFTSALDVAVRSARLIGVIMVLVSICWLAPLFLVSPSKRPMYTFLKIRSALLPLLPGLAYLLLSIALRRRQMWAAMGIIVIAGMEAPVIVYVGAVLIQNIIRHDLPSLWLWVLAALLLLGAALGQLAWFVFRAIPEIRNPPPEEVRGFAVARPVESHP